MTLGEGYNLTGNEINRIGMQTSTQSLLNHRINLPSVQTEEAFRISTRPDLRTLAKLTMAANWSVQNSSVSDKIRLVRRSAHGSQMIPSYDLENSRPIMGN
jgi:hypothetical protein